jgi:hypothetical protein
VDDEKINKVVAAILTVAYASRGGDTVASPDKLVVSYRSVLEALKNSESDVFSKK